MSISILAVGDVFIDRPDQPRAGRECSRPMRGTHHGDQRDIADRESAHAVRNSDRLNRRVRRDLRGDLAQHPVGSRVALVFEQGHATFFIVVTHHPLKRDDRAGPGVGHSGTRGFGSR